MADKKEAANVLERTYNVPLRREWLKVPKYRRAKRAVAALQKFLVKHMKTENVKIGKYANLEIWKNGIKSPPHHINVKVNKDSEGVAVAELVGAPEEKKVEKEVKKDAKKVSKTAEQAIKKELSDLEKKTEEVKKDKEVKKESKKESDSK
jgi:large subunit ribosomal protein L31e|tara:strand:+ start:365 stop:814 length:450 start_codon:yes stop_codon:yes gene_type:complete